MLAKLIAIDAWIMDAVVPTPSWKIEAWTGLNNFQQARIMLLMYLAIDYLWAQWVLGGSVFSFALSLAICVGFLIDSEFCERIFRTSGVSVARVDPFHGWVRALFWASTAGTSFMVILVALVVSKENLLAAGTFASFIEFRRMVLMMLVSSLTMLVYLYLLARSPMPPQREHEWMPQQI